MQASEPGRDTEQDLIRAASTGDTVAMAKLYDLHADRVYTIVRRLAGEDALAEDWCQDAWIRIFDGLREFRGEAKLSSWIHRVAVNSALNGRRRQLRFTRRERALSTSLVDTRHDSEGLRRLLEAAISRLPEGMRKTLVLHDIEGYAHAEISTLLGTTESNSRSQLVRARAKLRAWIIEGSP